MFRPPRVAIAAATVMFATVLAYALVAPYGSIPTQETTAALTAPAYLYFVLIGVSGSIVVADFLRLLRMRAGRLHASGVVPLSPGSMVPYVLTQRRYGLVFGLSALAYGLIYSVLTSVVAYRPDLDFSGFPGLQMPSIQPDQLVGIPLFVPELTVFVTSHFALVLIPLTLLMMIAVSVLVGMNLALAAFAFDNRVKVAGGSWTAHVGALVGLFTGCPTCAGLYFFSLLGGTGAASFAVTLDYYQPLFVALTVPILLVSPLLVCRALGKAFRDGCVVVPKSPPPVVHDGGRGSPSSLQ